MTDAAPTKNSTATRLAESAENVAALVAAAALPVLVPTWPHEYSLTIALSAIGVPGVLSALGKRRGVVTAAVVGLGAALPWLLKGKNLV